MKKFKVKSPSRTEGGNATVELALILPVLFLLGMASLDLSRTHAVHQTLSTLTREAANSVFRECSELTTPGPCIASLQGEIAAQTNTMIPGAQLIVSIYKYDPIARQVRRQAINPASGITSQGYRTKYTANGVATQFRSIGVSNPILVISEVFYKHSPISRFGFSSGNFYETTAY